MPVSGENPMRDVRCGTIILSLASPYKQQESFDQREFMDGEAVRCEWLGQESLGQIPQESRQEQTHP